MEENLINNNYEKNEYIFKIIYLIRINLPSSEFLYIFMFLLKYIGLILFSMSLNQIKKEILTNPPPEPNDFHNKKKFISQHYDDNIYIFFSKVLFCGNNIRILNGNYQMICIIGFCLLLMYIFIILFGFFYMRNKYYDKNEITPIEKQIKNINNNSNFEEILFKYITFIFFLIVFFHQYIIEYYIFGFIGYILNLFNFFETISVRYFNKYYYSDIDNHLKNLSINPFINIIINGITIIIVLIFFISFLFLNSTKTIFIKNSIPLYANKKYLFMKIIILNYNNIFGMINLFSNSLKLKIIFIIIIMIFIFILLDITLSYYRFSFYPSKLNYFCSFVQFFVFFSIITEIIIYLIDPDMNLKQYNLIVLFVILINSIIFMSLFFYKKNKNNLKSFSDNLFSKTFKTINPEDIYYYIGIYLEYCENKENNYLKLFKLIQNHTLKCDKKECPGNALIPKSMSFSPFTNFSTQKNNVKQNENKNNIIFTNEENNELDNIIFKNLSDNPITKDIKKNNLEQNQLNTSFRSNKEINKNLKLFVNTIEKRKSAFKRKNTENIGSISLFSNSSKPSLVNNTFRTSKMKIENNLNSNVNINDKINKAFNYINKNENDNKKLNNEQFIMIGEQEIINRINFLYKRKKYGLLQDYIFLHLQYLLKIKQNYRLALYFVGKYLLSNIKFSFLSRYYLYEIKRYICNNFMNQKNSNIIKDQYIINYKEDNIFIKKFLNYTLLYLMIKKLLKISCEKIIYFYTFKAGLHNSLCLQKYSKSKIYPIIKSAEDIQTSISKLRFLIKDYYQQEKIPIESIELSYLISNFIKLIDGKISQNMLKYFTPILYFKDSLYEKLSNEFHRFMTGNPLILNLTQKDTFDISYFSLNILDKLGYSYTDLKNKDFHEKLFPGTPELIKEHNLIMKEFLFFYKNVHIKDKTFLKSKEGFLISINFICKIFPNFERDFFLITNISFNEDSSFNNFFNKPIEHNKKTNNFNSNDKMNIYSFLLDYHFDFFYMTKNFYLEYDLNQNMFRELRINFCQFFCVNENKLNERINKEKKKILKKYPISIQKISLRESNRVFTIFQNIKIENTFKLRNEKLLEGYFIPFFYIYDKIDKKKIVHKIPEIINLIDEIGLDYDWYIRLQNFKERLISNGQIQNNIKETGISNVTNYNQQNDNRRSTIVDLNLFEINMKNPGQFFEVVYLIRKLGSTSFYIVNLYEKIINNSEEIVLNKELEDNTPYTPFNKRHSSANLILSKKFRKLSSQKSIKFNNLFLSSSKLNEEENTDENGINRKAKTKVFFPMISGNIINKNINSKESQKKDEKINKMNSLNNLEVNKDNLLNKIKENTNTINNIKRNSNEIAKTQKSMKTMNNKDNIRTYKISKKEYLDEDESTELIPKDKFNEILKNLNKKNRILIIIIFILIILSLFVIVIKFRICMIGFEQSQTLLESILYLEMIKVDIYSLTILSIIYCMNDTYLIKLSETHNDQIIKKKKVLEHLKLFQKAINSIINYKNCQGISKILNQRFSVYNLNIDWSVLESQTSILEEIRKLSFKTYNLINNNETCNIKSIGYSGGKENMYNNIGLLSNNMERILFYFVLNSLRGYRDTFNQLNIECANSIEKMFSDYQKILFSLLLCIIIILTIFVIFYIIKVCYDYSYYHLLFLYYYHIENEQLKFENQLYHLYSVIQDFNNENINYFEYSKNTLNFNFKNMNDNINKNTNLNNNINSNVNKFNSRNSLLKKKNKKNNSSYKNSLDLDNNNINILNGSINGSSLQLLNNPNNHKIMLNNNLTNNPNSRISIQNENEEKEDSIESLLKISNKILPNSIKISLIFIIVGVIIYILICSGNLYESKREKNIRTFSINLSLNILERVPRLMSLLIYSMITVITNNPNQIRITEINNNKPKYLTYFKANSLYYSEDIMTKYFNNIFFGELLKDCLRINYNFNNYLFQKENNIFSLTKYYEILLNTEGYFCIYASIGDLFLDQESNNYSSYDFMNQVNNYTLSCKYLDLGIDESGVKLEINYILEELTDKYIDFITYNNSNLTLDEAKDRFFGSTDIKRIFIDMQYPLILYYDTIIYAVYYDFKNQSNSITNTQILFDAFLFLVNLLIIICLLYVVTKGEKYKRLFAYFLEIPKTNNS